MLTRTVCSLRYKDDPNIVAMTALADAFEAVWGSDLDGSNWLAGPQKHQAR